MEHFTAIKLIERLAPSINESQDPKGTLIKYASENNLSPAELERLGQVYNSAKTLSHLEKSANRGDSYTLLDINELMAEYVDHSTPIKKTIEKSASSNVKNGGYLPNFFNVETLEKSAAAPQEHELAYAIHRNVKDAAKQDQLNFISEVPTIIHELTQDLMKQANDINKQLYLKNIEPNAFFTKLAADSLASENQNKDAIEFLCRKAVNYFGFNPTVEFEKLASSKVVMDRTGFLDKVEDIQEKIDILVELKEIEKRAASGIAGLGGKNITDDELAQLNQWAGMSSKSKKEKKKEPDSENVDAEKDSPKEEKTNTRLTPPAEEPPTEPTEAPAEAPAEEYTEAPAEDYTEATTEAPVETPSEEPGSPSEEPPTESPEEPAASVEDYTESTQLPSGSPASIVAYLMENQRAQNASKPVQSAAGATSKDLASQLKSFIDDTYENRAKKLLTLPSKGDRGYVNASVDKTVTSIATAATIHELMQDPIIAAHSPRTVVSIYNSLAQINPKMMQDKNVAKFALREALQYEGITPHSYGQMAGIEKDRAQTVKDVMANQKSIYDS
jgi:outer membrane biosynthesis protein TonB